MAGTFINTTLVDGYAGGPHIKEDQIGRANQGVYGPDDYVLDAGRCAEATILTNNSIRLFDAVYVIQGRRDVIAANNYEDVSIDNGAQDMYRNDIIVRRYEKDASTEVETTSYAVLKGIPSAEMGIDPEVTAGNLNSGDTLHEMPLYRVRLEGLNIVAVEPLFKVLLNKESMQQSFDAFKEEFSYLKNVLNNQVVTLEDAFNNTGEYVTVESSIFKYNKLTGAVHGELVCTTKSMNDGVAYNLGDINLTYAPLTKVAVTLALTSDDEYMSARINERTASASPGRISARTHMSISKGNTLCASFDYFIEPGLVD